MVEHSAVGHKVLFNRECKSHKAKVNRNVEGSSPSSGANFWEYRIVAIAGDCKSPGLTAFVGASPTTPTILNSVCSSVGRAEYLTMG